MKQACCSYWNKHSVVLQTQLRFVAFVKLIYPHVHLQCHPLSGEHPGRKEVLLNKLTEMSQSLEDVGVSTDAREI